MFEIEKYDSIKIKEIMTKTPEVIYNDDRMEHVMSLFEKTKKWNLPVLDHHSKYIGMVSQSTLFSSYRNQLLNQTEN